MLHDVDVFFPPNKQFDKFFCKFDEQQPFYNV